MTKNEIIVLALRGDKQAQGIVEASLSKKEMTKREWIIRLMQGMIGNYGNREQPTTCWYNGKEFKIQSDGEIFDLDLNWVNPTSEFYIIDQKGIPMEDITICNIDN